LPALAVDLAARQAGMPFTIFPHMLRYACGYALANAGTTRGRCI
jgi:hypothetical protein